MGERFRAPDRRAVDGSGGPGHSVAALDLIVHRHDMPIFPGNAGDIRVGFGLWKVERAAVFTEALILLVGAFLYQRAATEIEREAKVPRGRANRVAALIVACGLLVLTLDVTIGQLAALKATMLAVRFALELLALGALAYWGFSEVDGVLSVVLGIGAAVVALVDADQPVLAVAFAVVAVVDGVLIRATA